MEKKMMNQMILTVLILIVVLCFQLSGVALARDIIEIDGKQCVAGEVIVEVDVSDPEVNTLREELQVYEVVDLQNPDARLIWGKDNPRTLLYRIGVSVPDAIATYKSHLWACIRSFQPNYLISTTDADPNQWGLHNTGQTGGKSDADIDAPEAWAFAEGKSLNDVTVAVIDSGVDGTHPDLQDKMWVNPEPGTEDDLHGYNFVNNTGDSSDDHGHGTHVAGIIASVCPSAKIMSLKFVDADGYGLTSDVIRAFYYAIEHGAKIVNNSWEGESSDALKTVMGKAFQRGMLLTAGSGNSGTDNDVSSHYPSGYDWDNIISVAATDHNDDLAIFSNYGVSSVDLAAPGVEIYSTLSGGGYGNGSGTSMATAYVSGVAALVWALNPEMSYSQVRERILNNGDAIPELDGKMLTGQRLNAYKAVACYFQEFQSFQTNGAINWEFFAIDGENYLAVANNSGDNSEIYRWDGNKFNVFQSISASGAHDWKFFEIAGDAYLALANYSDNGNPDIDSKIYKWDGSRFNEFQSLPTHGAHDWEVFSIADDHFLAVANSYRNKADDNDNPNEVDSVIYKWSSNNFAEYQTVSTVGATDWEFFSIDDEYYLAVASWSLEAEVYKWNGSVFTEYQSFPEKSYGWESFTIDGNHYMALAKSKTNDNASFNADSLIYQWDGAGFVEFQSIPTHYAWEWEYFSIGDEHYLAVPNARNDETFDTDSAIYKWDGSFFSEFQSVPTLRAINWEYFTIDGEHYLAVANNKDSSGTDITDSKIYKLSCSGANEQRSLGKARSTSPSNPDVIQVCVGETASVPLVINNIGNVGIEGVDVTVEFDESVLIGTKVVLEGSVLENQNYEITSQIEDGKIMATVFSNGDVFTGSGILMNFEFNVVGEVGDATELTVTRAKLNESDTGAEAASVVVSDCPDSYEISGIIRYYGDDTPVSNVLVELDGTVSESVITGEDGRYSFSVPREAADYTITAEKSDQLGGLSGLDASKIAKYAAGFPDIVFNCHQMIAADVNMDGQISGIDASRVARYSVGKISYLNWKETHWVFVPANTAETCQDWPPISYESERSCPISDSDMSDQDFVAIRLGDVTGNWSDEPARKRQWRSSVCDLAAAPGSTLTIPLVLSQDMAVEGIDVKVTFDETVLDFRKASLKRGVLGNKGYALLTDEKDGGITLTLIANGDAFSGSGEVAFLTFDVIGQSGDTAVVSLDKFECNEAPAHGGFEISGKVCDTIQVRIGEEEADAVTR